MATPESPVGSLLEALAAGDPNAPMALASRLAREFSDPGSYRYYSRVCGEAWSGGRELASLESAYRQAVGPKARNAGKVFAHALKAWDVQNGPRGT